MAKPRIPFDGTPPDVKAGDLVKCRTADGKWVTKVAVGPPRYDDEHGSRSGVWLTVPVAHVVDGPDVPRSGARWVNWPAQDVRPVALSEGALSSNGPERRGADRG